MARWRGPRNAVPVAEANAAAELPPEEAFERTADDKIVDLGGEESAALEKWRDRLSGYVDGQGSLDALRLRRPSDPPWPAPDNPMLGYLYERSREIVIAEGADTALAWLASNAWFEGAIAERSRFARHLNTD